MIRVATEADVPAIMVIEHESFPGDAWSASMMADEVTSPHGQYVVAVDDDEIVGYAGLRALQGSADSDIQTIALLAGHRGKGTGRRMLRHLLAVAIERGARETFLDVRADNAPALALYASEGFAEVGRRRAYYRPDGMDAIVMRLELRAWEQSRQTEQNAPGAQTGVSPT